MPLPQLKRVYDIPADEDGMRVLVDRLWPRGLTKDKARIDLWLKDIAPGDTLRLILDGIGEVEHRILTTHESPAPASGGRAAADGPDR